MSNIKSVSKKKEKARHAKWPPIAQQFVLQSDQRGSTRRGVWVISHESHGLPQSCRLLHADNIDMPFAHVTLCFTRDKGRGAQRNENSEERKDGEEDSDG